MRRTAALAGLVAFTLVNATPADPIRLANNPALSPDGQTLLFDWNGDVWACPSAGGVAKPLTAHPARDREAKFSPDGQTVAFVSDREGTPQVFSMPATGGTAKQVTRHTAGYSLHGFADGGKSLLVSGQRDHFWRHADRFFLVGSQGRTGEELLFDDYGSSGSLSPDGRKLLFVREGTQWWRKGYTGSQAAQIWLYDRDSKVFTKLVSPPGGALWPLWKPDASGFYYVGAQGGTFNLHEYALATKDDRQLTRFPDDSVVWPCLSADGSTLVFRHLFDFYRFRPGQDPEPVKLAIETSADRPLERIERKVATTATAAAFTSDALEIAFVSGGDLWVMDTELREPKAIAVTPEEERSPVFAPDNESILFVSDAGGQCDVWKAEKGDKTKYWWQNSKFKLTKLTSDGAVKNGLEFSPDGSLVAFQKGRGELWVMEPSGKNARKVIESFSGIEYDWSPDGKWMVISKEDADFNRDVFILPVDGSKPPVNVSRHPRNDGNPAWSPDGKIIAFTGTRKKDEVDMHYVYLRADDDEVTSRERALEKALEKMNKVRKAPVLGPRPGMEPGPRPGSDPGVKPTPTPTTPKADPPVNPPPKADPPTNPPGQPPGTPPALPPKAQPMPQVQPTPNSPTPPPPRPDADGEADETPNTPPEPNRGSAVTPPTPPKAKVPDVVIDWDRLHERVKTISIPDSSEGDLMWSPDSKRLAFTATVGGSRGTYTVEFPEDLKPKQLNPGVGRGARWLKNGTVVWLANGVPASFSGGGSAPAGGTSIASIIGARLGRGGGGLPPGLTPPSASPTPSAGGAADAAGTSYRFQALQTIDLAAKHQAGFDAAWRTMRDNFYDERLGNRDWNAVRAKYHDAAATVDPDAFATCVNLMLGELNGSHLGFYPLGNLPASLRRGLPGAGGEAPTLKWSESTAHFGLRFVTDDRGPGLKIRDVIPGSPADVKKHKFQPGEVVTAIDGTAVKPDMDLTQVLNGPPGRDVRLTVKALDGKEREVVLRPITFSAARTLLAKHWIAENRKQVDKLSNGTLGYLHIDAMDMDSFYQFETDLYAAGGGKEGLVIDVRENGGGSTADLLLTALTTPTHAITIPRGGATGYPHDRLVFASWTKPIVVLCNQNSFSNAEIFSHAIRTLNRGHVVGAPSAGGVISTGATTVMDLGMLRLPFRGWYSAADGQDMELNGAQPHFVVWPEPGQMPAGKDVQLEKGVSVLLDDVKAAKARPAPSLKKASERK